MRERLESLKGIDRGCTWGFVIGFGCKHKDRTMYCAVSSSSPVKLILSTDVEKFGRILLNCLLLLLSCSSFSYYIMQYLVLFLSQILWDPCINWILLSCAFERANNPYKLELELWCVKKDP